MLTSESLRHSDTMSEPLTGKCGSDTSVGLYEATETRSEQQARLAFRAPFRPASSQAERNILLCESDVNMLWLSFFSVQ